MDARREPEKISNDALMDKLALEQSEVEDFARGMNLILSGLNGGMLVHQLIMISLHLAAIGFVSSNGTVAARGLQISVMAVTSIYAISTMMKLLLASTAVNNHWELEKKRLLNDARVQGLVGRVGQSCSFARFDWWLENHELRAMKAFGTPVTSRLQRNVGSLVVSTFALVLYFLLREELRGIIA